MARCGFVHSRGESIRDSAGTATRLFGVVADITEMREAELALAASEERFRLMAETISDVFWLSTPGVAKLAYISPAYERIWGQTRAELYREPRSFLRGVHPEDRAAVEGVLESRHRQGLPYSVEYRLLGEDGTARWIHERGYPIRADDGRVLLMTGVCTDITERKQAERRLMAERERAEQYLELVGVILVGISPDGDCQPDQPEGVRTARAIPGGHPRPELVRSLSSPRLSEREREALSTCSCPGNSRSGSTPKAACSTARARSI